MNQDNIKFSKQIRSLLKFFREKNIDIELREMLLEIVMQLDNRTELQKIRFALYYKLITNKKLSYADIAKLQDCSVNAVRVSVLRVVKSIVCIQDERKELLLNIIKNVNED